VAEEPRIKVGVGVMVWKDGKLLFGKRKNAHGAGEYASPGGHVEFGESIEECAKRETLEESGIIIKNIRFVCFVNLKSYPGKHYAHIQVESDWVSGEPIVKEPDKCEGWDWYDPENIPKPNYATHDFFFKAKETGQVFFDA
jgi:8-oxo-dGTP diphosphatase